MNDSTGNSLIRLLRIRAEEDRGAGYTFLADRASSEVGLSFSRLDLLARAVAAALQERGMSGQRALLCYPAGLDFLVGLFGCLYAGVIAVPVYPPRANRSDVRLDRIADQSGATLILTNTKILRDRAPNGHAPWLRNLDWIDTSVIPESCAAGWTDPDISPGVPAILQYTSGSTGQPKGVILTHAALLHNLAEMQRILGLSSATVDVCWLPIFHDMGLIGNFLQAVHCGMPVTFMPNALFVQDPLFWLQTISSRRAYLSGGPPFAFQHCVKRLTPAMCEGLDLSCWQMAYVGAETVPAAVLERFAETFAPFGFRRQAFFPTYGLAESTLMVTGGDRFAPPVVRTFNRSLLQEKRVAPDEAGQPMVGCGRALPGLDVRIVDPDSGETLPDGRVGEIWVSGPSVAQGYWNLPEESARTFQAKVRSQESGVRSQESGVRSQESGVRSQESGVRSQESGVRSQESPAHYLRTGDLGFFQENELFISGRLKDLIIVRGRNYYPQDLEEAATTACPELYGKSGAAFTKETGGLVIVHEAARAYQAGGVEALFGRIRETVAEWFELEVQQLVLIKAGTMPRTTSGKVQRQECARRLMAGELAVIEAIAAAEPDAEPEPNRPACPPKVAAVIHWLTARLAKHLNLPADRIDVHKPFAGYGLDSLALVNLAADFEKWLGRPLSPTLLYSAPTIDRLARAVTVAPSPPADAGGSLPEPIAVIGIGCHFPQADGPDQFWQLLRNGSCVVGAAPENRRWPASPGAGKRAMGGYLSEVQYFDAPFFGVNPREAVFMDPQHRLLLETAWEALEHAGTPPDGLAGRSVGVFVGVSTNDYGRLLVAHLNGVDAYLGIGNSASMAAQRISYHLDLHGPSVAVDTACSSSLVAVHLACQSLRSGESELALAGGVNLILSSEVTDVLAQSGMLSSVGQCKTFDAAADGYVRGEGCGVIVLKPLTAALRDGDPVWAVLEASAVNQDGKSNGITAPNGAAQTALIRRSLQLAGRSPDALSFIEAHGTGTSLGDPIEFDALQAALGSSTTPCTLASVKTNLGHLEAAAGIAGLIKTILQVQHGEIAPHLHLEQLNPRIGLAGSRFGIPREATPWTDKPRPRLAGVSSFGFGGTNAHVLVGQAATFQNPPPFGKGGVEPRIATEVTAAMPLLPLSAKSQPALQAHARRFAAWLRDHPNVSLRDIWATAARGRCHFEHRLAVRGEDRIHLVEALETWASTGQHPAVLAGHAAQEPRVAFLFTGQGSVYASMGRKLAERCRVFRDTLNLCRRILESQGISLGEPSGYEETAIAQPALFALEYALAQTWRHWGIEPAALLGHSVGEYVAACVAGVLSVEDGLRLIASRGKHMQDCPEGAMLACFAALEEVTGLIASWNGHIQVAVINGPEEVVVAGDPAAVVALRETMAGHGIETRFLKVRRAFHSALMEPALPGLRETAARLTHRLPSLPLISNLTGKFFTTPPSPLYWAEQSRGTVQFATGVQALEQAGITHFLEVGPDAILSRLGPACLESGGQAAWLPSLRRGADDWSELLNSLGRCYVSGAKVNWDRVDDRPHWQRVGLPTYPFEKLRYWFDELPSVRPSPPAAEPSCWRPWSNWRQCLPRRATGFAELAGGLQEAVAPVLPNLIRQHPIEKLTALREEFDALAGAYVVDVLDQLGWHPRLGEQVSTSALANRLQVIKPYDRLLDRLLQMGAEDGWLESAGPHWRVIQSRSQESGVRSQESGISALLRRFPGFEADLRLADRCASRMHLVMRGEADPLEVLFGDEAAAWTERLYRESPVARFYNELTAGCLRELVGPLAARRPVRLLEVGAGTGGTTAQVLPGLPADRVEYVFTDVSKLFVAQAAHKFRQFPFVHYRVLDVEQPPATQELAEEQFDFILAANVLHATSQLRQSIRTCRRLLTADGILVLLEGTGPRRLLDLIFGLTAGWWKFADLELRPHYPLLPPSAWARLLAEEGFADVTIVPAANHDLPEPDLAVILARKSQESEVRGQESEIVFTHQSSRITHHSTVWVLAGGSQELVDELAARLTSDGDVVMRVHFGDSFDWEAPDRVQIRPRQPEDIQRLLQAVQARDLRASIQLVDFAEGAFLYSSGQFANVWVIGDASEKRPHFSEASRIICLDPNDGPPEQATCLREALRFPDDQRVVAYRRGQRYVPESASRGAERNGNANLLDRTSLLSFAPPERRRRLEAYLHGELHSVLGLQVAPAELDRPLNSFGIDSLMSIQLRNHIEAQLGISLSVVDFLKGLSLRGVIDKAVALLGETNSNGRLEKPSPAADLTPETVDQLSEDKLDAMLKAFQN